MPDWDADGERLQGLRDLLAKLREERQERLDRHDLGGEPARLLDHRQPRYAAMARWGVTVLQAVQDYDAGEVWAWAFAVSARARIRNRYRSNMGSIRVPGHARGG